MFETNSTSVKSSKYKSSYELKCLIHYVDHTFKNYSLQ